MKTKEAIEFLEDYKFSEVAYPNSIKYNKEINDIISLLQQGKKYRQMWEELKAFHTEVDEYTQTIFVVAKMDRLEQKYFPKVKKTIRIKYNYKGSGTDYKEGEE